MPCQAQQSPSCLAPSQSTLLQARPPSEDRRLGNKVALCLFHLRTFARAIPAPWHSPPLFFTDPLEAAPWAPKTHTVPWTLPS